MNSATSEQTLETHGDRAFLPDDGKQSGVN